MGQGEAPKANECMYHPGVPIFHEGLKFWTCCMRKTTDFQAFLNQAGCTIGNCKWKSDSEGTNVVECRFHWHQTATHVVVAIYGKKYDPDTSYVELSPVRMKCHIVFPEQGKLLRHKGRNQDAKSRSWKLVKTRHPSRNLGKERSDS